MYIKFNLKKEGNVKEIYESLLGKKIESIEIQSQLLSKISYSLLIKDNIKDQLIVLFKEIIEKSYNINLENSKIYVDLYKLNDITLNSSRVDCRVQLNNPHIVKYIYTIENKNYSLYFLFFDSFDNYDGIMVLNIFTGIEIIK